MNFAASETHRMLADTLDRVALAHYPIASHTADTSQREETPSSHFKALAGIGTIGALFAESDGGYGGGGADIAVVFEGLGRGLISAPVLGALMVGRVIAAAGSEDQKKLLPGLIDGTIVAAWAHEEPGSHYELSRVTTRATWNAGVWHLTGAKSVVLHGEKAQWFLVTARSSGAEEDEQGLSLFLVPATAKGCSRRSYRCLDGQPATDLTLDNVHLPSASLMGIEGAGFALLEWSVDYGLLALCAEAVGAMDRAKDYTVNHLQTRQQFKAAIGTFQALQHRMAVLALEIEQARSAVINAAHAMEHDRCTRERTLSAAKYAIGRIGLLVAEESIQLHGAMGMTWEAPISHYAKRLIMIGHQLGDEDHHLQRYIELGRL